MVLGGGAFGRWLGHEGRALMNGIIKVARESSLAPSAMWGYSEKMAIYEEAGFYQTLNLPMPWSWTSHPPELWDVKYCYLWATQSMAFFL